MTDIEKSKRVATAMNLKSNLDTVRDAMEIIAKEGYYVASVDDYISLTTMRIKEIEKELHECSFNRNQRLVANYISYIESRVEHLDDGT